VKWIHNITNNEIFDSYNYETSEVTSTIKLTNLTWSDRGPISCTAESILGNASAHGNLNMLIEPKIKRFEISLFAYIGSTFTFPSCNAVSNPPAVISWKRDIGKMNKSRFSVLDNAVKIFKVHVSDEGFYTCTATNFLKSDEITVHFKIKPLQFQYVPISPIRTIKGKTVLLSCSAYGDISEMKGKWIYSNTYWNDGSEITSELSISSNMLYVNATAKTSGVYECQIQQKKFIIKKKIFVNFATIESNILNIKQKQQLVDWLSGEDQISSNYALCIRVSTRDEKLDTKCGSITKTLTIIKDSAGCIFGGYSSTSMGANTVGNSFLFDFNKNRKFKAKLSANEKSCSYSGRKTSYGPCFGKDALYTYTEVYQSYYSTNTKSIYYSSNIGVSFNADGQNVGCRTSGDVSVMEILYKN